ncbi:MAG: response regulator [Holophagales bacterium]|nr:response regulator [Holophagales bacterium]MXX60009.1 response regulator [Holophagales bacterium]MYC10939.1 response regulator [Holophagales bacterium]MYD21327.1 response regulator [Holophagales bacterium]MYI32581.1 response regulator [Holophagales bacterium]
MSATKVVVIEDESDILELIEYNLRREGFEVATATSGRSGLSVIGREKPDIVLLDLLLPGLDGLDVCRRLRAVESTRDLPVIMVTARGEESDVVLGLGVGADDYIHKPFSPRELIARVRAVLRRGPIRDSDPDRTIVRGPLAINPVRHRIKVDGRRVEFTPTEFRLLHFLASHPGRVFTRGQLLDRAIGDRAVVIDRNIDVHVRAVRRKLGAHRGLIRTVRGIGYCFRDEGS